MNSRQPRRWVLLSLAALSLIGGGISDAAASETYQGTPVGFTADGHPFRGDPNAPLTLVEYSDYLCPFCGRHFHETLPALLDKYGRPGQVKFVFRDFPLVALHPTAPRGHVAASCVGEQGASRYWQMHGELFRAQQEWNRLADPAAFMARAAQKAGADMKTYERCVASGRYDAPVQKSVAAGQALGFNGTPTFQFVHQASGKTYTLVGAQPLDVFVRWIDALLAGKEPPKSEEAPAPKPELPFWAKPEGLAPDPKRPGFTVAGDPYKGNPNAKLVMVEFGDFQCPACQRHALETQPTLDKRFVETGEIRWVSKHFPLGIHPHAPAAAAAAECAGDQGQFWPMHHLLFERMEQWSTSDDVDTALTRLATGLGLDKAWFTACLTSRQALERVLRDLFDGQAVGVRNVPAFVLLRGETRFIFAGARPTEQFASVLQRQLERLKAGD